MTFKGAVSDTDRSDNHYRIVDGDRLMWSGRLTATAENPQRHRRALLRSLRRIYPQLREAKAAYVWSGTYGRTLHRMPQIGEIQSGLWVASGFTRHGLNNSATAGMLIARAIAEHDDTWRLFSPYELVWTGGTFGRRISMTLHHVRRPARSMKEALDRYRERRRSRAEEAKPTAG